MVVPHDERAAVYVISVAAELAGMHPQTLRTYDRLGLVTPGRSTGRGRRYSASDVERLREVQRLSQDEGLNLEGIRRVLAMQDQVAALQARVIELQAEVVAARHGVRQETAGARGELVPVRASGAVVVWQRPRRPRL